MKSLLFKSYIWEAKRKALETYGEAVTRRLPCFPKWGNYQSVESDWVITPCESGLHITLTDGAAWETKCGKIAKCMQDKILHKPFQHGEIVFLREAFYDGYAIGGQDEKGNPINIIYRSSYDEGRDGKLYDFKWKSPYAMTEALARTFFRIKDVRPERLQEITEEDALKEGIELVPSFTAGNMSFNDVFEADNGYFPTAKEAYAALWDSINPKTPWSSNCWVFRIEFERTERPK